MSWFSTIESGTKTFLLSHLCWAILVAAGCVGFHSWLQEHDARILAEQTVKAAQAKIDDLASANDALQKQIVSSDAQAKQTIATLQKRSAQVKTNAQAIAAIPDVSSLPAQIRPIQNSTDFLLPQADLLPLFQELSTCKQDAVALSACQAARANDETMLQNDAKAIAAQKDEIKAITKKPSFWKRVESTLKQLAIGAGIGFATREAL